MATNAPRSLQVIDPVLTQIARRYKPSGFIGDRLLAPIPVSTLSSQYPTFDSSYWFQNDVDNLVADRAPSKEIDFKWSLESFICREYALKVSITDLERMQAHAALRLESNKTDLLTHRMQLATEVRVAKLLSLTTDGGGILAANTANGSDWDSSSTVEDEIKAGVMAVYTLTGLRPNVIVLPFPVAYSLALNGTFRNLLKYDASGRPREFIELGDSVLPAVIHGMTVIIPEGAQIDTAKEGSTAAHTEIWGEDVRLLFVNPSAGWGIPSVAYKFNHTAKRVTRWREVDPDIEYVREMERYDLRVVAPECGYVIKSVLS